MRRDGPPPPPHRALTQQQKIQQGEKHKYKRTQTQIPTISILSRVSSLPRPVSWLVNIQQLLYTKTHKLKITKTQILERRAAQIHLFSICQRQRAGWGALGRGHRQPIHRQILIGIVTDTTLLLPSVQDRLQVCCITLTECRPSSLLHSSLLLLLPQSGVVTSQKRGRPPDHCQLSILQFLVLPTLYFPHYSL